MESTKIATQQERIRYIYEQTGQTQKDFADTLGIGQPHLSGIMSTRKPSKRLLLMIAEKTGANINWLETGNGDVYTDGGRREDPPELTKVIDTARDLWAKIDDAERYEMAATLLREMGKRKGNNKGAAHATEKAKK